MDKIYFDEDDIFAVFVESSYALDIEDYDKSDAISKKAQDIISQWSE